MEHRHRCVYCDALWFCYEECALPGPSACDECREKIRRSPDMPRRVIALGTGGRTLDLLTQREAERLRQRLRGPRP